ncbi:hypothetical protein [Streptomyces mirabilis]|uniref:hypothetical protein n=1 Tax=Streptomyces mirabilis TaxID=68239 RepID=UPI0036D9779C
MGQNKQAKGSQEKPAIVIAGEGQNDRAVLRHLLPALLRRPASKCPKIIEVQTSMRLKKAENQLAPRLDRLRLLADGQATRTGLRIVGVVVHVDLDAVIDDRYTARRKQLSADLQRAFDCDTALALAADEMEAWLMLFPDAFPKVKQTWRLTEQDRKRNLGAIASGSKELLKARLSQPRYKESDAPAIMQAAVTHGLVASCQSNRNRSYADFATELEAWK